MQECAVAHSSTEAEEQLRRNRDGTHGPAEGLTIDLREKRNQIRSRERVRDLAEVYTDEVEVGVMLDLVPDMFESIDSTFLEPACGDGNFLVEILERKSSAIDEQRHGGTESWVEMAVLRCVASIYAIDISEDNINECRLRMATRAQEIAKRFGMRPSSRFTAALAMVLETNVVVGDTLNGAEKIEFVGWRVVEGEKFVRTRFPLVEQEFDLFYTAPEPGPAVHFGDLHLEMG